MGDDKDRPRSPAEDARDLAEARNFDAEAAKFEAETRSALAEAAAAEIELAREKYKREKELAGDEYHRVFRFTGAVDGSSVKTCMSQLAIWSRTDPGCAIEIVFSSPGGSIIDGLALFDFLQGLKTSGHHITTKALGYAASMAGILLQAGDHRVMSKESWLLIHEASFGAIGSFGEVSDTVEWVRKIQERILAIFAERSNLSKRQIKRRWHRKDWWIDSDEALKLGLIDAIA